MKDPFHVSGGDFGLIAATFTAFRDDGGLDLPKVEEQARALSGSGLTGVFVCGTTGEGASLSTEERTLLAERWHEAAGGELEVIVHVGHTSLTEARSLAEHAERTGADGIAAVAPYYHRPRDVEQLVGFCAGVAAAAAHTPFYYYHIPSMTGVVLSMAEFLTAARGRIPTLAGIKFTHEDLADYGRCLDAAGDKYELFFGRDEMLLAALGLGARSAVGSTYNFAAPLYREIVGAFDQGDLGASREAQSLARNAISVAEDHGGLPAFKAMTRWFGPDCGPCRPPLRTLGPDRTRRLREELEGLGFFARAVGTSEKERGRERDPGREAPRA
jgi:N-acetylneuraminate lyase